MNKLRVTSSLLAGVGLVGASARAGNDLAPTQTRDNTTRSVFKNATTPTDFSGGAAGNLLREGGRGATTSAPGLRRVPGSGRPVWRWRRRG